MKTWPTLYKRSKTGAIQFWNVLIEDEQMAPEVILKESGQLGTANPTNHFEVVKGKNLGKSNETTPAQQAILQAESDWKRKHDEGYKGLEDLDELQADRLYSTDDPADLKELLEKFLPKFNTDASGNVKPMLAKVADLDKVQWPQYIQPKLDGVRCLMKVAISRINGEYGCAVIFFSRSGKEYTTLEHIATDVMHNLRSEAIGPFILDGEIYSDELTFQQITKAVKKQRPESLKLHFRAYDMIDDQSQAFRINSTRELVNAISSPYIHMVDTTVAGDKVDVKLLHDKWVKDGYEGAMLRHPEGHYAQGQRSSHLLKVKEFDENEFQFLKWEKGQRDEDLLAVCKIHTPGPDELTEFRGPMEFKAKMTGSREQKKLMEQKEILPGSMMTIKHFGWTDDGLPRFPIGKAFRDYE